VLVHYLAKFKNQKLQLNIYSYYHK